MRTTIEGPPLRAYLCNEDYVKDIGINLFDMTLIGHNIFVPMFRKMHKGLHDSLLFS